MFNYRIKNGDTLCYELLNTNIIFNKSYPINYETLLNMQRQNYSTECTSNFIFLKNIFDGTDNNAIVELLNIISQIQKIQNYNLIIEVSMDNGNYVEILNTKKIDLIYTDTRYNQTGNRFNDGISQVEEILAFLFL